MNDTSNVDLEGNVPKSVLLVNYDQKWPEMFEAEKRILIDAVGKYVEQIEHVGSTSVPGLVAKPVIDILMGSFS